MGGNASEKEATKNEFLKHELLCMIAELEKGSYSDVCQTCMEKIRVRIHLQRYDSRKKFVEGLDEGEVKEAGSCRTFASQMGGPSWSDNRFVACRFGQGWGKHI